MKLLVFVALWAVFLVRGTSCWDQSELDLFDLVEEIDQNFYEILGVNQTSTAGEIKRAFRHLSLKLHPDKSDDPNATEKFRQLVAVAEVLKDDQLREWYDQILVEGLPDWKQPLYYYRRVRKMGLFEMSILVMTIATVGHYLYGWAAYLEKQLVLNDLLSRKQKRERKTKKSTRGVSQQLEAELQYHTEQANASKPSFRNLLPVALVKGLISLAKMSLDKFSQWKSNRAERQRQQQEENETRKKEKETLKEVKEQIEDDERPVMKRRSGRKNGYSQRAPTEPQPDSTANEVEGGEEVTVGGFDSGSYEDELDAIMADIDEDQGSTRNKKNVVKLERKIEVKPSKIKVQEVLTEDKGRKRSHDKPPTITDEVNTRAPLSEPPPRAPLTELAINSSGEWSQYQQSQLEWALAHFPKFTKERWENISKSVPGKSTEDCVTRCKELYDAVRKRRSQKSTGS